MIKTGELVKSQYLFLNGDSSTYTIDFDRAYISCENDETLSIVVEEFSLNLSSYIVTAGNNVLTFVGATTQVITIPPGTYSVYDLQGIVTSLMTIGSLVYNQYTNTFTFNLNGSYTLHFTGSAYSLFGFRLGDVPVGSTITSTGQVSLRPADNIFIKANGINSIISGNLENFGGGVTLSSILAMIPFVFESPWSPMWWHNENSRYEMFIREKLIDTLDLVFVDNKDKPISFVNNYVCVLRVNTYKSHPVDSSQITNELLSKLLEVSTNSFTMANLDLLE